MLVREQINKGGAIMLQVSSDENQITFGSSLSISFIRTLRIPDDGKTYPLPPGLGHFPICRVSDYKERVPETWLEHGGVFIPMYQREALWISFVPRTLWKPNAVKIAIGKVNAISGSTWEQTICDEENDYIVCPPQPWLDGINAGEGYIRQFVSMPLGMGYTVEAQVTGKEEFGGIQIIVYEPKAGKFSEEAFRKNRTFTLDDSVESVACSMELAGSEMGLAAGGKMQQSIYPDPHGVETWDANNFGRVYVHIVNSMMYEELTGNPPPKTPITAKTYTHYGYPWFTLYDEHMGDISPSGKLKNVKSVKEMDKEKGFSPQQDDSTVDIPKKQIVNIKGEVKDGKW